MKKVLCIGHAAYDMTIVMDNYPIENTKYRVDKRIECGGGPASNSAYLLGKWGMNCSFAGIVGNDIYGNRIKKELEEVNVDTSYLELTNKYNTTTSFIVVNKENGSRTIFSYREKDMLYSITDVRNDYDYILVDGQEPELSLKEIKENPQAISILDAGRNNKNNIMLGKVVDYLVTSRSFAEEFSNVKIDLNNFDTVLAVYEKMEKEFKGHIVITLEEHGCLYKYNNVVKLMPGYKTEAKDTTAAGDIYHGAFVYGLMNNYKYEDIMRLSNIAGALSVTKIGGRYSVPTLEEVLNIYEKSK